MEGIRCARNSTVLLHKAAYNEGRLDMHIFTGLLGVNAHKADNGSPPLHRCISTVFTRIAAQPSPSHQGYESLLRFMLLHILHVFLYQFFISAFIRSSYVC
jgi:hypothetical protein